MSGRRATARPTACEVLTISRFSNNTSASQPPIACIASRYEREPDAGLGRQAPQRHSLLLLLLLLLLPGTAHQCIGTLTEVRYPAVTDLTARVLPGLRRPAV